jgi:hypothetical protein
MGVGRSSKCQLSPTASDHSPLQLRSLLSELELRDTIDTPIPTLKGLPFAEIHP